MRRNWTSEKIFSISFVFFAKNSAIGNRGQNSSSTLKIEYTVHGKGYDIATTPQSRSSIATSESTSDRNVFHRNAFIKNKDQTRKENQNDK